MRITTPQAQQLLARDMDQVARLVWPLLKNGTSLNVDQFGAICALAMNIGVGKLGPSQTLARLNAEQFGNFDLASAYDPKFGALTGMAKEWAGWRNIVLVDGSLKPELGLVRRRAAELELFFTGKWSVPEDYRLPQAVMSETPAIEMWRPGMRSPEIVELHEALAHAGFPTTCGDAYTWVTTEAVKAFQQKHGLKVDGIYGKETARKLAEVLEGAA
jgi:GH24 family phage-related lysozyme (muramidase)